MAADLDRLTGSPGLWSWRGPVEFTLKNGLRVLFTRREKSPVVEFRLVLEGGFAADSYRQTGLATLAMAMFSEGLVSVGHAQLRSALDTHGALVHVHVMPDGAVIGLSALNANFVHALTAYIDALTNPEFKTKDFELLRENRFAQIAAERLDPFEFALRVLPPMIYGEGHIYARPFTGSGTERDVAAITCDDLRCYYATYLTPESTALVVVGPCETTDLHSTLEQTFGEWEGVPMAGVPAVVTPTFKEGPSVLLVNRPGASQTVLAAGLATFPRNSSRAEPLMVLDTMLGGLFTSRLNLSLREQKGWTYGVRSAVLDTCMQGMWLIRTAVRNDCAVKAMAEIAGEFDNLAGRRPSTPDEFSRAVDYLVARIPSSLETCAQMADTLANVIVHRLPFSYLQNLASRLRRLTPEDVTETCRQIVAGRRIRWMVVGEAGQLTGQLRDAGFENIKLIESNGTEMP